MDCDPVLVLDRRPDDLVETHGSAAIDGRTNRDIGQGTIVEKRGATLVPVAVVPNATKALMVVPEHMNVLPLALDRITEGLPHRRR